MMTFEGLSCDIWVGAILGAILGAIVVPFVIYGISRLINWTTTSRPRNKALGSIANDDEECTIFIRDCFLPPSSQILAKESASSQYGIVPNVSDFRPSGGTCRYGGEGR